jgi:hypothetical protein
LPEIAAPAKNMVETINSPDKNPNVPMMDNSQIKISVFKVIISSP